MIFFLFTESLFLNLKCKAHQPQCILLKTFVPTSAFLWKIKYFKPLNIKTLQFFFSFLRRCLVCARDDDAICVNATNTCMWNFISYFLFHTYIHTYICVCLIRIHCHILIFVNGFFFFICARVQKDFSYQVSFIFKQTKKIKIKIQINKLYCKNTHRRDTEWKMHRELHWFHYL